LLRSAGKKTKKGEETRGKSAPCGTREIGGKMKRKRTKRKQQGCDVAKVIDTVEQAVFHGKKGLSGYRASCERIHKSTEDQITTQTKPRS
jgi:hypothetical protein